MTRFLFSCFVLSPVILMGSGSYTPRLPGAYGAEMARYELGKAIASGKIQGSKTASAGEAGRMEELNGKLPLNARKQLDLTRVSGLTAEQMQALEYFLGVRYKVK